MPIYEYQCNACGHTLEALQKIGEDALTDCPKCNQAALQKLVSSASFQLKGSGWYASDFKNKPEPETKKETPQKDTTPKETISSETKAEAKGTTSSKSDTSDSTGT